MKIALTYLLASGLQFGTFHLTIYWPGFKKSSRNPKLIGTNEGITVEYKQSFGWASISDYFKAMASFANRDGGYIIFGVKDKPHELLGLQGQALERFTNIDNQEWTTNLKEHFAPEIVWEKTIYDFEDKKYDKIVFIYNQFKNAATQILVTEQFLPIMRQQDNGQQPTAQKSESESDYIFQPNREDIIDEMIPKSLKLKVYKILLNSYTSEQGARMISMTQATDNATELLKELNLSYNKARQSAITNELVEIVSGAEALKG